MPTPVTTAGQCLTPEAAQALEEAVAVARRRGHGQTTSLHAVSALLSLPSSPLRDACTSARNSIHSLRLQFKALELCLSVSLDRISSGASVGGGSPAADPPVSNSFMAAIKRSQANQRRQPENYYLYHHHHHHQIPNNQSTIACVKVELQHLTLSILDDPVVSRVFGEAGFRSSDIKMAILRPFSHLLKYSSYRNPPVFLRNITEYSTPNVGFGFSGGGDVDENSRRIAEVLGRSRRRNPLLVGVCAYNALQSFTDSIQKQNDAVLPPGLSSLILVSIESEVSKSLAGNSGGEDAENGSLFREARRFFERCYGSGIVTSFGDLKAFSFSGDGDGDFDMGGRASFVVGEITRLLEVHGGKVCLIGATASYESYLKFVSKFPLVEKDWDLQLLPITSPGYSSSSFFIAQSYPRSSSMESFVPFGGFFSAHSNLKFPLSGSIQCISQSQTREQEIPHVSKGSFASSVVVKHCESSLPFWLQMATCTPNKALDVKTKDDGESLNANAHHHNASGSSLVHFPTILGFQSSEFKRDYVTKQKSIDVDISSYETTGNLNSSMPLDVEKLPSSHISKNESFSSKGKEHELSISKSPNHSVSCTSTGDENQRSPASAMPITTDLALGISLSSQTHAKLQQDVLDHPIRSPSPNGLGNHDGNFDPSHVKMLFRALSERVSWQWEAISAISQAIIHCQTRKKIHGLKQRGDIWLSFIGPDLFGKKKITNALAEVLYGKRESLISVDLNSQNGMIRPESTGYNVKLRR